MDRKYPAKIKQSLDVFTEAAYQQLLHIMITVFTTSSITSMKVSFTQLQYLIVGDFSQPQIVWRENYTYTYLNNIQDFIITIDDCFLQPGASIRGWVGSGVATPPGF